MAGGSLLPVINRLQTVARTLGNELHLPQIVVVGGQSAGKSSVLESLVHRDFLPRGSGIVTRRPLVLQLSRTDGDEWAEFAHAPGKRFTDFAAVRTEIKRETDRIAGANKGVSPEPIVLKVFAPHVTPLTLVDTPGIARVPVGDQPADIESQIRTLVSSYIANPNAIILAVHAANQDMATSDALKLAREVDPKGARTLGVLTKIDLMDAGDSAVDMLLGRVVPLRLGFVGLVNRSQADVKGNVSVARGLADESKFFISRAEYAAVASHCGTGFLERRLSELLAAHIRRTLPSLVDNVAALKSKTADELRAFGVAPAAGIDGRRFFLMQTLANVSRAFNEAIDGTRGAVATAELNAGARIRYVFQDMLRARLDELRLAVSSGDIRTALTNASGVGSSLFVPEAAFELLVRTQIARLREPILATADQVHAELLHVVSSLDLAELHRFPALHPQIVDVASAQLRTCLEPTKRMLNNLIDCELAYIGTAHPEFTQLLSTAATAQSAATAAKASAADSGTEPRGRKPASSGLLGYFFGSGESDSETVAQRAHGPPTRVSEGVTLTDREALQVRTIRNLLDAYFTLVKRTLADQVPKAVMHFLVANARESLQRALLESLYKDDLVTRLLTEDPRVAARRAELAERLRVLESASEVLSVAAAQVSAFDATRPSAHL